MFIIDIKLKKQLIRTAVMKIKILYFSLNIFTGVIISEGSSPLYVNRSSTL